MSRESRHESGVEFGAYLVIIVGALAFCGFLIQIFGG